MKRWRLPTAGFAVLSLLAIAGCGSSSGSSAGSGGGKVNIGLLAEFSGARATLGPAKLQGMEYGAQLINAAGGCDGKTVKIDEIDGPDPVDTQTNLTHALALDNLSLVVGPDVNSYTTALPTMESDKMVNFTYIGTPGVYSSAHYAYSYRSGPSDAFVGAAMAYYAHVKGYKRIAIAISSDIGGQDLIPSIKAEAKSFGLTIVANESIPISITTYAGYIKAILNAKPDAVLFQLTTAGDAGPWATQWQADGGTNIPIIGSDFTAAGPYVQAMGVSYTEKHLVSAIPALAVSGSYGAAFVNGFTKKFNTTPPIYASHFYDSMMIACLAMDMAHSTTPSVYNSDILKVTQPVPGATTVYTYAQGYKLIKEGKRIKYYGVGGSMTFTPDHSVTGPYQVVTTAANGNTTVLTNIAADKLQAGASAGSG
jgi:ABC-type branched-subunit amino acid transport system substrate-binding protein